MSTKEQYAAFCRQHPDMPVMMQPWWLEAVCAGKQWDVILVRRSELSRQAVSNQPSEDDVVADRKSVV